MKFIHFGCWNSIDCSTLNFRDIVLNYIKNNEDDYEFLIVSGDNWYSNKIDETKYYFTNVLQSGFIKLYNLDKTCHIILGNHDEDVDKDENPYYKKANCMLNTEKYYIKGINDETLDLEHLAPSLDYLYSNTDWSVKDNAKLLLYEAKEEAVYKYIEKYNALFIFINTNIFDKKENVDNIKSYIATIKGCMQKHPNARYFITGHVPITSKSVKKSQEIINNIHHSSDIMNTFIAELSPFRPVYLCADTHNFQVTTINDKILQVVVGTGGADPDVLHENGNIFKNTVQYSSQAYNVNGFYNNSFGYSVISMDENTGDISVEYKKVIDVRNKSVSKHYIYNIKMVDNLFNLQAIKEVPLDGIIETLTAEKDSRQLCSGLTENHLVKENYTYCYKKYK